MVHHCIFRIVIGLCNQNIASYCSFLMNLIPSFNKCADKVIEKLKPLASGINSISISEEFSSFTLDVISKVWLDSGVLVLQ